LTATASLRKSPRETRREKQVHALIAAGLATKDIAWRLSLSQKTVGVYIGSLRKKHGAGTRAHLALLWHGCDLNAALESGLHGEDAA
jgi:DNA-binding CsgD family transcriptional regulator